jgi:hypothetical protein
LAKDFTGKVEIRLNFSSGNPPFIGISAQNYYSVVKDL